MPTLFKYTPKESGSLICMRLGKKANFFKIFKFTFMCIGVFVMGVRYPGTGITENCELPCGR